MPVAKDKITYGPPPERFFDLSHPNSELSVRLGPTGDGAGLVELWWAWLERERGEPATERLQRARARLDASGSPRAVRRPDERWGGICIRT